MSGNEYTERNPMEAFLDPQNANRLFFLFLNHLFCAMGYEVRCTVEGDPKTQEQIIRATWKKIEQEKETADVAPVVRCKDCRHRDPEDHKCDSGETERQGCPFPVHDDYFCAYGEEET